MKPLKNSEIAAMNAEIAARHATRTPGLRTYPPMRSVDLLGGRQVVGYDHAAEVRDSRGGVIYGGTWEQCRDWARAKGCLPAHLS
jgi:hypothetical protein